MEPKKKRSAVLKKIVIDAEEFFESVERLSNASAFNRGDCKDAYTRLNRVRNRYEDEKKDLSPSERQALERMFNDDKYIEYMMSIRHIADHRVNRTGASVPLLTRGPFPMSVETSAQAFFAGPVVPIKNVKTKEMHYVYHLQVLKGAERILRDALRKAGALGHDET